MPQASPTLTVQPVGQYVTVSLLPDEPKSGLLTVIAPENMTRKATVLSIGQGVPDLTVGSTVLCRPLQGHYIGELLLLPHTAVIATVEG